MSWRYRLLALALLTLGLHVVTATAASAANFVLGTPSRSFALEPTDQISIESVAGDPVVVPGQAILFQYESYGLDPRSIQCLDNGDLLVASRDGNAVLQFAQSGNVVWSYTLGDYIEDFPGKTLFAPFAAQRFTAADGKPHTLITLRHGDPVFELDENKDVVWQFGTGTPGFEPGQVFDGFSANRLANGNTLIVDNQGCRVIEVRTSDYVANAPSFGFAEDSIVWQYGVAGQMAWENGYAEGYLDWPRSAQRLPNGNTLISDQVNQRAVEITPDGREVWAYGTAGESGLDEGFLLDPSCALRLADGTTLISHGKASGRVDRIDASGRRVGTFPDENSPANSELLEPRCIALGPDGTLYVADEGHDRLMGVGVIPSAKATSLRIDCALPGVTKRFTHLAWSGNGSGGVAIHYSIDGGPWKLAGTGTRNTLPSGTIGTYIRYKLVIESSDHEDPVRIDTVTVSHDLSVGPGGGDPDGDGNSSGSTGASGTGSGGTAGQTETKTTIVTQAPGVSPGVPAGSASAFQPPVELGTSSLSPAIVSGWRMNAVSGGDQGSGGPERMPLRTGGLAFLGGLWLFGVAQRTIGPVLRSSGRRFGRLLYSTRL